MWHSVSQNMFAERPCFTRTAIAQAHGNWSRAHKPHVHDFCTMWTTCSDHTPLLESKDLTVPPAPTSVTFNLEAARDRSLNNFRPWGTKPCVGLRLSCAVQMTCSEASFVMIEFVFCHGVFCTNWEKKSKGWHFRNP